MKQGLIADIDSTVVPSLWWLGQQSFVLKLGGQVIWLDPFLTPMERRRFPPPVSAVEVTNADFVFGSHDHMDHIDPNVWPVIAEASPQALFGASPLLRERARALGVPAGRFMGMREGEPIEVGNVTLHAVASAHERLDAHGGDYPYLGVVAEHDGLRVYHTGDTCRYEGLMPKLRALKPDVMIVPINGRDAERYRRGCIGNMTFQEAADLCGEVGAKLAIPAHWDMFEGNLGDPQAFADYMAAKWPAVGVHIPGHAVRITLDGPDVA